MPEITQKLGFDVSGAVANLDRLNNSLAQTNAQMNKMGKTASGVNSNLNSNSQTLAKAQKAADGFTVSWKTMIRVLQTQLIVRGLNAVIQGLQDAVASAQELGLAIEEIRTIDSQNRGALQLGQDLLALSDLVAKAPTDLAEGLYQTLSNQVVEAGDALNFTSEAAKLATITASETGAAVNALSSVMNSYGLEASETNRIAGTLFTTVEQGRLRLSEIANVIGRVTPLTAQLGIAWEEVAASIATMTRQGVRADTAITQLRAVITRLIKPTDDVRAIFRQWGVVDAKQAVQTFGGLTGVLQKLQNETGGSSQEFATLLRNVRAITGAMGILVDDGQLMSDIMGEMSGATEKANDAWAEFSKSESFRFQQSVQQLSNDLTRLGQSILPIVLQGTEAMAGFVGNLAMGIRTLSGEFANGGANVEIHNRLVAEGIKRTEELRAAREEANADVYDPLRNAMNEYYVEANKQEFALQNIRDQGIATATNVLISAIKSLDAVYSDSFKAIDKFNADVGKRIQDNLRELNNVGSKLNDAYLNVSLKRAENDAERLKIYEDAAGKAAADKIKLLSKVDASEDSLKAALDANKVEVSLKEKVLDLAIKQEKSVRELDRLQGAYLKAVAEEGVIRRQHQTALEKAKMTAQEQGGVLKDLQARLKAVSAEETNIAKSGEVTEAGQRRLIELQAERVKLQKEMVSVSDALQGAGVDTNLAEVTENLTSALDAAKKDWAAEVERMHAAFADATVSIGVELDPTGLKEELANIFKLEKLPSETLAQFYAKIDQAAADAGDTQKRVLGELSDNARIAAPLLKNLAIQYQNIGDKAQLAREQTSASVVGTAGEGRDLSPLTNLFGTQDLDPKIDALRTAFTELQTTLTSGGAVSETMLTTMDELIVKSNQESLILNSRTEKLRNYLKVAKEINNLNQQNLDAQQNLAPEETTAIIDALNEQSKQTIENTKQVKEEGAAANASLSQTQAKATQAAVATGGIADGLAAATVQANQVNTTMDSTSAAASSSYSAIDGITARLAAATRQAQALNAALAAGGGGGVAAAMGGRFFADGGMARGKDRIAASLASGETVVNSKSSRQFFSELNAMNQGNQPVYREQGGQVTNVGDVNVTVQGGDSSQQTVREIGHALRREIQRGNIKLR